MDYVNACPPAIVHKIQKADLAVPETGDLFSEIADAGNLQCTASAIAGLAQRMPLKGVPPEVVDGFTSAVATYARFMDAEGKAAVRDAYLRLPYDPGIAQNYFLGLRAGRIDIRDHLALIIRPDWNFESPMHNAGTWFYYLYLADLGTPGALDALAAKIAETRYGNDATLLLMSLAELPGDGVTAILRKYDRDPRTADGVNGPGLPIAQNIAIMLAQRASH